MAKTPNYVFSKKYFPTNARRITNAEGKRVWLINGREYPSRRAYFEKLKAGIAQAAKQKSESAAN